MKKLLPGLALCVAIALVATGLGRLVPVIGAPVFGILIGVLIAVFLRPGAPTDAGAAWAGKKVLQTSIVVLGTGLSIGEVLRTGWHSLPVMLGTLAVALIGAWLIGRALGVDGDLRTLIGVGTGICGASAIAATQAVIRASAADVAYSVGTIFTFNVIAVLTFPFIGQALGMGNHAFGLWAGTAINDTSSVVAASYSYSAVAGAYGVVVKLTRTLMIVPITVALSVFRGRRRPAPVVTSEQSAGAQPRTGDDRESERGRVPWRSIVPMFLVLFLVAVCVNSLGWIPGSWHPVLSWLGTFMITVALAGIGLGTRVTVLRQAGAKPLVLGACLWVIVALTSLGLQALTGTL